MGKLALIQVLGVRDSSELDTRDAHDDAWTPNMENMPK